MKRSKTITSSEKGEDLFLCGTSATFLNE